MIYKSNRIARLLESEAPTHEKGKATIHRRGVAAGRPPRRGAVARHRQQRALRAGRGQARAARRRRRPPRDCAPRPAPRAATHRAPHPAAHPPLPTHWCLRTTRAALGAVTRPVEYQISPADNSAIVPNKTQCHVAAYYCILQKKAINLYINIM